jgi:Fe2+ or Zn2+ uptake regulation protein
VTLPRRAVEAEMPPPEFEAYIRAGEKRGLPWTDLRLAVLRLLWRDRQPWGPYEISKALRRDGTGPFPNSIYRALRSLRAAGLIVPVVSSKRFRISPDPACADWGVFLCSTCQGLTLTPLDDVADSLRRLATMHHFAARDVLIESRGECETCFRAAHRAMTDTANRLGWTVRDGAANLLLFVTSMPILAGI